MVVRGVKFQCYREKDQERGRERQTVDKLIRASIANYYNSDKTIVCVLLSKEKAVISKFLQFKNEKPTFKSRYSPDSISKLQCFV
jgi:hypothetical protein